MSKATDDFEELMRLLQKRKEQDPGWKKAIAAVAKAEGELKDDPAQGKMVPKKSSGPKRSI